VGSIRRRGRRVRVILDVDEALVLLSLVSQVMELLDDGEPAPEPLSGPPSDAEDSAEALELLLDASSGPIETPQDPALLRLLPDGYRNDDDAAGEFRRLTESSLRTTKQAALQRVIDDVSAPGAVQKDGTLRCDLDEAAADVWLPALNSVRLVLGTRIGVDADDFLDRVDAAQESEPEVELELYHWLSWMQETIVEELPGR
jgi:hypothetical protein